jgi:TM2 domain-containing membrane protein YozV
MQQLTFFFWLCAGADIATLKKCPTEKSKYVGIGATVFFTGLFAALAGGYAMYTVFDNIWIAAVCGLLWGLLIFNLDRFIVSSMRKEGKFSRELLMATPRILLAILISVVIAKPLELKIFEKEINAELIIMDQQQRARQENEVRQRFRFTQDSLKSEITLLKKEIETKTVLRDDLLRIAREEADGTGGSRKKNLGPIYKIKKANADDAEKELLQLKSSHQNRISFLERKLHHNDSTLIAEIAAIEHARVNGPAARIEAMSRLTQQHAAMWWAEWFIIFLFIALETAPVFVKLISPKGPYDNVLKVEEYRFASSETEELAKINAEIKARNTGISPLEAEYITDRLDTALKNS